MSNALAEWWLKGGRPTAEAAEAAVVSGKAIRRALGL
jgi:hypothetical protein